VRGRTSRARGQAPRHRRSAACSARGRRAGRRWSPRRTAVPSARSPVRVLSGTDSLGRGSGTSGCGCARERPGRAPEGRAMLSRAPPCHHCRARPIDGGAAEAPARDEAHKQEMLDYYQERSP
jgi:hypothetical protein